MAENVTLDYFGKWYGGKRYFPMLLATQRNPLTFHERLCYSFCVYREAKGGTHQSEIARATGIDRTRTLVKVRDSLLEKELIVRFKKKLLALPPKNPEWFVCRKKKIDLWNRQLSGFPLLWSAPGWTPMQLAVYCCLFTNNVQDCLKIHRHQKKKGIAAMLGVSHDTVQATWQKIEACGLLYYDYLRKPTPEILALFPDRPAPAKKGWQASIACGWRFDCCGEDGPAMAEMIDRHSKKMLQANYSKPEVAKYWDGIFDVTTRAGVLYDFLVNWEETWAKAEQQTVRNRTDGKFFGRNSYGFLKDLSKRNLLGWLDYAIPPKKTEAPNGETPKPLDARRGIHDDDKNYRYLEG